jgi:hypothetical protein
LKLKLLVDKLQDYKEQLKKLRDQNLDIANTAYERAQRILLLNKNYMYLASGQLNARVLGWLSSAKKD